MLFPKSGINGNWSSWSPWSTCATNGTCPLGQKQRTRSCTNPSPIGNGSPCLPANGNIETQPCTTNETCTVNGNWTAWSTWSPCVSDGNCPSGTQERSRSCTAPAPIGSGLPCFPSNGDVDSRPCTLPGNCKCKSIVHLLSLEKK